MRSQSAKKPHLGSHILLLWLPAFKFKLVLYPGFEQAPKHGVCGREESFSSKDPLGHCIKDQTEIGRYLVKATATLIFPSSHAVYRYNTWLISGTKLSLFFLRGPAGQTRFLKFWVAEQKLSVAPCPLESFSYVSGKGYLRRRMWILLNMPGTWKWGAKSSNTVPSTGFRPYHCPNFDIKLVLLSLAPFWMSHWSKFWAMPTNSVRTELIT